jgi:hypothetical protein
LNGEANVSRVIIIVVLVLAGCPGGAFAASRGKTIRLAQSSITTTCMMTCNSQAASCQAACVVPGTPPLGAATTTSNASASISCLSNCSSQQLACQTTCARISPSQ